MPHYSILAVTPTSEDWVADYLPRANSLVAEHGGRYLARTADHTQLEGDSDPAALRIVIEWPTEAAARAFMDDVRYAPHLAARAAGSKSVHYLVAGKDDLA